MKTGRLAIARAFACAVALALLTHTNSEAAGPRRLILQIDQVKAIKECRGPFGPAGADEIDLGVVAIDSIDGVRSRTLDLGQFGHDESTKNFRPPRPVVGFKIAGGAFPKVRQAILVLAERDAASGFGKYLDALVKKGQQKLDAAMRASGAAAAPGYRAVGYRQGEAVAKELAQEAAKKLGQALFKIATDQLGGDDIFPPSWQSLTVLSEQFRFANGGLTSPKKVVNFKYKKNSCDYDVTYSWRLE